MSASYPVPDPVAFYMQPSSDLASCAWSDKLFSAIHASFAACMSSRPIWGRFSSPVILGKSSWPARVPRHAHARRLGVQSMIRLKSTASAPEASTSNAGSGKSAGSKGLKVLAGVVTVGGLSYVADRELNASALARTFRCGFYA